MDKVNSQGQRIRKKKNYKNMQSYTEENHEPRYDKVTLLKF